MRRGSPTATDTQLSLTVWLREEEGVRDMCILEAPEDEGIYISELDVDKLRSYKECEVMGDKFRHPEMYGELVKNSKAR